MLDHLRRTALASVLLFALCGCASGVQSWIVDTRNRQGDIALHNGNLPEASLAYRLALQLAPKDEHARAGLSTVQQDLAAQYYRQSHFDDALVALSIAAKYDAQSVRVAELRSNIEQARIKREIVVSNYPSYKESAAQLKRAYENLKTIDATIVASLQRFNYSFDTADLSLAIRRSYELNAEVAKNTNRLATFRQLVESGVPDSGQGAPLAPPASLLPLP